MPLRCPKAQGGVWPPRSTVTRPHTNSRRVVPVLAAGMIAASSFALPRPLACHGLLPLLRRTSVVTAPAQTDQVVIIVRATQFNGHNVVYLDGLGLAAFVACLAHMPITFENARTNRQPSASLHSTCTHVAALCFTSPVLVLGHTHAHTLRRSIYQEAHTQSGCRPWRYATYTMARSDTL